ncbi:MAG: DUF3853 family protein [Bacteroidota bacterium]|nr:DUF3853 family protein [Bacteroidota bacterium]
MKEEIYNLPITRITVRELIDAIKEEVLPKEKPIEVEKQEKYVYGLDGLAKILGCSKTTAFNVKQSGKLDDAIFQNGRKIIIDVEKAIKLFRTND